MPGLPRDGSGRGANLPGNVGPDLSEIGNAGPEDEWLFNTVYDGARL